MNGPTGPSSMSGAISMLIADDDRMICDLFLEAAQESQLPFRISTTDNGRDCLTLLHGGNIDIAFIDINMPELSGMEAIWVARKQGINTFVTLMSGERQPNVLEAAQKVKAYEFLAKPFSIEDILAIIRIYARVSVPMKVLIVDDSSTVRTVVQHVVEQSIFTCEVTQAADAATAIECCKQQAFDIVLLDCNMPHMDGLTALRKLRAQHPGLKVVMISSERDPAKERASRDSGAHGFLHKPFYPENIDRMLHAIHRLRLPTLNARAASSMAKGAGRAGVTDPALGVTA
jgi:CheY-like chemotaxis protein